MKSLIMVLMVSFTSAVWSNEWTPLVATEGAMLTLEKETPPAPQPMPKPNPDGAGKGAQVESPLDSFREAKALIAKGNALADRGKAILDRAQQDGKITVDIRLPTPPANDSLPRRKTMETCPGGTCPLQAQAKDPSPANGEPMPTCNRGDSKSRRFLRWRR